MINMKQTVTLHTSLSLHAHRNLRLRKYISRSPRAICRCTEISCDVNAMPKLQIKSLVASRPMQYSIDMFLLMGMYFLAVLGVQERRES